MSEANLNLETVTDIKIRNDGNEVQITFQDGGNKSVTITSSLLKMDYLLKELTKLSAAVLTTRLLAQDQPSDKPRDFSPMIETHLALDTEFVLKGDGGSHGLDLVVQTDDGRSLQLSLLPDHVRILRQLLQTP